jgi:hypothetical protein
MLWWRRRLCLPGEDQEDEEHPRSGDDDLQHSQSDAAHNRLRHEQLPARGITGRSVRSSPYDSDITPGKRLHEIRDTRDGCDCTARIEVMNHILRMVEPRYQDDRR